MPDLTPEIYINGYSASTIALPNRGVAYGDGLFETMRVQHGRIPLFGYHYQRLLRSAAVLQLNTDKLEQSVNASIDTVLKHHSLDLGVLKLIVLRRIAGRGYGFSPDQDVDVILEYYPGVPQWNNPANLQLGFCDAPVTVNSVLAGHKHLNRLDSVLAARECADKGWETGILCDQERVIETVSANIFLIEGQNLYTPALDKAGVAGVLRTLILERSPAVFTNCFVQPVSRADVINADALFICNSVIGIRSVTAVWDFQTSYDPQHPKLHSLIHHIEGVLGS